MRVTVGNASQRETGGLEHELELAEGAVVKLTTSINVADGLANGARGVVDKILTTPTNDCHTETDNVHFFQ